MPSATAMDRSFAWGVAEEALLRGSVGRFATIWRRSHRFGAIVIFSFLALAEIGLLLPFLPREKRMTARVHWLHQWCRFACRVLGVRVKVLGKIPSHGLIVCNHLSYLDIIVLSALQPCVFVAKSNVSKWPLFGWLARAAGTVFVERERKLKTIEAVAEIDRLMDVRIPVILFAEGTSSDGRTVLPFKSSLLEPAAQAHCRTSPAAIGYSLSDGSVAYEVCYWGDMTLLPHLANVCGKASIDARVQFGQSRVRVGNRKQLAQRLHEEVAALHEEKGGTIHELG